MSHDRLTPINFVHIFCKLLIDDRESTERQGGHSSVDNRQIIFNKIDSSLDDRLGCTLRLKQCIKFGNQLKKIK